MQKPEINAKIIPGKNPPGPRNAQPAPKVRSLPGHVQTPAGRLTECCAGVSPKMRAPIRRLMQNAGGISRRRAIINSPSI